MALCGRRKVELYATFRSEREEWVQGMVQAGLGFAFMPEHSVTLPGVLVASARRPGSRACRACGGGPGTGAPAGGQAVSREPRPRYGDRRRPMNLPVNPPLAVLLGALLAGPVCSQSYPTRALRIVVPSSAGSGADFTARLISQPLSERLGQQVVVENRAGASTMIGTEQVVKSAPDGYTVLLGVGTMATVPAMYRKAPYDAQRDLAAITQLVSVANVLVVHPSLPAKSVKELVALARARPGEIAFASSGTGTLPHLSMELLLVMTGTKMLHVPYKGPGPGLLDLVAGRVSAMTTSTAAALPHVRSGRLRLLGVTAARRIPAVPEAPTIAEAGVPGYESSNWWGLLVPAGTPGDIVARLQQGSGCWSWPCRSSGSAASARV